MYLESVITCVDYGDFLAHTLPHNRVLFDRTVVVTAPEDKETRRVCEYWHVECIPTDVFDTRWGNFCKGSGVNVGLAVLNKRDWVLHLDADIMLPPLTRKMLEQAELDPTFLYGCDRYVIKGDKWHSFMSLPHLQHENHTWVHANAFPLGTRLCPYEKGWGYIPIGFFQLWSPSGSGISRYPEGHTTAAREDTQFAMQWPRGKRALLPEIIAYHLESDDSVKGNNWNGRITNKFGPEGSFWPPVCKAKRPKCDDDRDRDDKKCPKDYDDADDR